jgi:hypothetical protein
MDEKAELAELEELEELEALEAQQQKTSTALANIKSPVQKAASYLGKGLQAVDSVTGAPVRAAIGAIGDEGSPMQAFGEQFGADPSKAPSGKDLAARAGLSTEEFFDTRIKLNPFTGKTLKVSPAGVVGGGIEALTDPTTYIGGAVVKQGAKSTITGAKAMAPEVRKYLQNIARERAVKAATGENRAAIKKLAKMSGKGAGDIDKAVENLRRSGEILLEGPDPTVRAFSTSEGIGERAAAKRRESGKRIGKIGETVEELTPNAITGEMIGMDLLEYADTIPSVGKGAKLKDRVIEEAERFGSLSPQTFKEVQDLKGQFPYEPQSPDLLISDKDVSNKIHSAIGRRMDAAVEQAKGVADPEQQALLSQYGAEKERYGVFKNTADAATEQKARTLARRLVEPSTYGTGAATMVADAASGGKLSLIKAMAAGAANKLLLQRGNSTMAVGLNNLAKAAENAPRALKKYEKVLQGAAMRGTQSLVATHHLLMNNDEEYRNIIEQTSMEGEP